MGLFQWPLWAVEFADFQLALVDLRYTPFGLFVFFH